MHSIRFLVLLMVILACAGCEPRKVRRFADTSEVERYAVLPLAAASHDGTLRAEVAHVLAEKGGPAQLAATTSTAAGSPGATVLAQLSEIFPADAQQRFHQRLENVYPDREFHLPPLMHESVDEILRYSEDRRGQYLRLMAQENLPLVYPHARGFAAPTDYISAVEIGNRLVALSVAEDLEANQLEDAIVKIATMLRAAEWLSREQHSVPRSAAAHRRHEALVALAAVARHPQATRDTLSRLLQMVEAQLARWPADSHAWFGDRAEGLLTYELVRDGYLLSIVPFEDLQRLREEVGVDKLGTIVAGNLDFDQQFYLQAMRKILASCERPFAERIAIAEQIQSELEELRNSNRYPFVADQLLLQEVASRHQLLAIDRARCEAWQLALRLCVDQPAVDGTTHPLTGQPWEVRRDGPLVTVKIADDEPPVEVVAK